MTSGGEISEFARIINVSRSARRRPARVRPVELESMRRVYLSNPFG